MKKKSNRNTITRREILKQGLVGAGSLAFALNGGLSWAAPAKGAKPAKAKSVIQIWMWGGPAHLDTFDPKPEAGYDYCGPYKSPIATNVDGIQICEAMPLMAQQADKYAIIRSMTHGVNAHETASYLVQTGRAPGRLVYPCAGAVVSLYKGRDAGYDGFVDPYVVLTQPQGRFSEAGFLGSKYKPFATGGDPAQQVFAVSGIVSKGITDEHQKSRRELVNKLDKLGAAMPEYEAFKNFEKHEDKAYELMFGEARQIFDLTQEKEEVREKYGRNTFGQSCLMARRLVEQGVPYITINYKGWDTHKRHFETMRQKLPELDQGFAALLQDLSDRGLLDSTIVWWGGEFGRGPKVDWDAPWNGGRSHYGRCFTSVVAGGGFKGGHVIGASDEKGMNVAERPVSPQNLIGSIYELMGIDPDGPLKNPKGMALKVLDPKEDVVQGDGRLYEIM
ncbi:MAG: DUF1501 domain-containing protein [Candidatus Sumerlaeia bacterium]